MARLTSSALFLLFVVVSSFVSISEGRKFLVVKNEATKSSDNSITKEGSSFLTALPKGTVPSSAPSKKGHAMLVNNKLIARHLVALDRSLRSVPSPGVGH